MARVAGRGPGLAVGRSLVLILEMWRRQSGVSAEGDRILDMSLLVCTVPLDIFTKSVPVRILPRSLWFHPRRILSFKLEQKIAFFFSCRRFFLFKYVL